MNYQTFGKNTEKMNSDSSNSSSRDHINVFHSAVRTRDSPFGKLRLPSDLEKIEIIFLVLATASTFAVIGLTIYRLLDTIDESDSAFALLLLVNAVFCLWYIYHGVFGERPFQLWAFMIAIISVSVYCVIQFIVKQSTLFLIRLILLLVFAPADLILCFIISKEFYVSKNLIIRTIRSANVKLQNMCLKLFAFQTLLILEFQTAISLIVLVLTSGVENASTGEIIILSVGIFVGIAWLVVGYLVPKYEDKTWLLFFLILSLPQPAYVLYKIIKTGMNWSKQSKTINISFIACACLYMAVRSLVSIYLYLVVRNFGLGLRDAVYFPDEQTTPNDEEGWKASIVKSEDPSEDYLGDDVNYDVHE